MMRRFVLSITRITRASLSINTLSRSLHARSRHSLFANYFIAARGVVLASSRVGIKKKERAESGEKKVERRQACLR